MNTRHPVLPLLSLLLHACGGGGDGGGLPTTLEASSTAEAQAEAAPAPLPEVALAPEPVPAPAPPPAAKTAPPPAAAPAIPNSGRVSARFEPGPAARYQWLGAGSQVFGALLQSEQATSGALTRLNDQWLSGAGAVQGIDGDAGFAIGRWVAGTVTRASGTETLTGTDGRAYHYLALNAVPALPASGAQACDAGVFTTPSYIDGGTGEPVRSAMASGMVRMAFTAKGAEVSGSLSVSAGSANAEVGLQGTIGSPAATPITGAFLRGGSGAVLQLGPHGRGGHMLGVGYAAQMPGGARYMGVALFRCA